MQFTSITGAELHRVLPLLIQRDLFIPLGLQGIQRFLNEGIAVFWQDATSIAGTVENPLILELELDHPYPLVISLRYKLPAARSNDVIVLGQAQIALVTGQAQFTIYLLPGFLAKQPLKSADGHRTPCLKGNFQEAMGF